MEPAAKAYLAGQLELVRGALSLPSRTPGERARLRQTQLTRFDGGLDALAAAGAISGGEHDAWHDRMLRVLGLEVHEPLPPPQPGRAVVRLQAIRDPEAPPPPPPPEPAGSLLRTIWGPSQSWALAGGRFQILSVEVYERGVVVTWHEQPRIDVDVVFAAELAQTRAETEGLPGDQVVQLLERARRRLEHQLHVVGLTDDRGTLYRPTTGGGGGGPDERRGHQGHDPAPPPEARRLTVTWRDQSIEIPLPPPP